MINKNKIKCILVDLDDTLLANARFLQPIFLLRAFRKLRPELGTVPFLKALSAMSGSSVRAGDLPNHERFVRAFATATGLSLSACELLFEDSLVQLLESCRRFFRPISGGVEFIREMSKEYPIVLATNPVLPGDCTKLRVSWTGLSEADFIHITNSQNSHAFKPSARYYEDILSMLEQRGIQPDECLFIGNDDDKDGPAVNCGITTVLVRARAKPFRMLRAQDEKKAALFEGSWDEIKKQFR
jgi:FMN phosphatase YigB (HAD superfamily)